MNDKETVGPEAWSAWRRRAGAAEGEAQGLRTPTTEHVGPRVEEQAEKRGREEGADNTERGLTSNLERPGPAHQAGPSTRATVPAPIRAPDPAPCRPEDRDSVILGGNPVMSRNSASQDVPGSTIAVKSKGRRKGRSWQEGGILTVSCVK